MADASLSLQNGIDIGSDDAADRRYEVADNTARDLLITQQKIKVGRVILHTGENRYYKLETYPTVGSLVGVVWTVFGEGTPGGESAADTTYDNTTSGLAATDVQAAIDELESLISSLNDVDKTYPDIAARDADTVNVVNGESVFVVDASADPTVNSGWAIYRWNGTSYDKITEQEDLDIDLSIFLTNSGNQEISSGHILLDKDFGLFTKPDGSNLRNLIKSVTVNGTTIDVEIGQNGTSLVRNIIIKTDNNVEIIAANVNISGDVSANAYTVSGATAGHLITSGGGTIDPASLGSTPVLKLESTHSSNGTVTLNLDNFDFDKGTTLNANITELIISNGSIGKTYTLRLIQGATGGSVTLAELWAASTLYSVGDKRILSDGNVYNCITSHTSSTSDLLDRTNWELYIFIPQGTLPVVSDGEGKTDYFFLLKATSTIYVLQYLYDQSNSVLPGNADIDTLNDRLTIPRITVTTEFIAPSISDGTNSVVIANILETTDVINDLVTGGNNVPLSADQGVQLKALIDTIGVVTKAPAIISSNSALALDLNTFNFDLGHLLNANITELQLSNGSIGIPYTVRFIQGLGGTLTLASDWLKNTAYSVDDKVIFRDSSNNYVDNWVYRCILAHTSDNTGTYGDYTQDILNWTVEYKILGKVKPILSLEAGQEDFMYITPIATGVYKLEMDYE